MNWVLITLSATSLWAVGNYIDKFVIDKHSRGLGGLTIYSGLAGFIISLILFLIFAKNPQPMPAREAALTLFSGFLLLLYILPYFKAMSEREASEVVPLFQLIPSIALVLSFFLIGEKIDRGQLLGLLLAMIGSVTISTTRVQGIFRVHSSLFYMALSSAMFALSIVLFKFIYLQTDFWTTLMYTSAGSLLAALTLSLYPPYRGQFFQWLRLLPSPVGGVMILNSTLGRLAQGLFNFATTLAPVSLVAAVDSTQPAFVLIYGVFLTLFFPKLIKEDISVGNLFKKAISLAFLFAGVYLVSR
ncbi:MAG: DMT family transporter [Patescibacteria group bacterium]